MAENIYAAIDLKSFYASVECVERGLNPLTTNLVVADKSRTEKTICLAVAPPLKAYGITGRPRLFEVVQKVLQINSSRRRNAPEHNLTGSSYDALQLAANPALALDYIVAVPRMAEYIKVSSTVYQVYLKYIAPEDIHVYSIDEVFIRLSPYFSTYRCSAHELVARIVRDVLQTTGITATAGIGTNLYLAKVAMDIVAKHLPPDKDGVRIAYLDEELYRRKLWEYRPLTDFWRIGHGYSARLERYGLYTMGDIARCSVGNPRGYYNEDLLYKIFGVNAELLIDHAWGWEPCTMEHIKSYRPAEQSLSSGQVLTSAYDAAKARIVVREMAEGLALDLLDKGLAADQIVLTVGYDAANLLDKKTAALYTGEIKTDCYGRKIPRHTHGSKNIGKHTASAKSVVFAALELYDRIVNRNLLVRRLTICANHVLPESELREKIQEQDLFGDSAKQESEETAFEKERRLGKAILGIKKKFGRNAILKGTDFEEGATGIERSMQIGGHRA